MTIRPARPDEYQAVRAFYHAIIDGMAASPFSPGWEKDIYPSPEDLRAALAEGALYLGELDGAPAAAMVVNHHSNPDYARANWSMDPGEDKVFVIHLLGVRPDLSGQGLAREMAQKALDLARTAGGRTVRLDVLGGNLPAERAYTAVGFRYVDTLTMYYEDTGWMEFRLFEYIL